MKRSGWQLCVVACHLTVGLISLSIAIPPGFSSPIWPASAVAVAAFWKLGRHAILPIFVSTLSLNLVSRFSLSFAAVEWAGYATIAVGTVLQGALGGEMARRLEATDPRMSRPVPVLRSLALLIFVSCLVNASFSVPVLTWLDRIPSSSALSNWLTWWMGDAMGMALVFVPLFLWLSSTGAYQRKRAAAVSLLSVFLLVLFTPLFLLVVNRHEATFTNRVSEDSMELAQRIESLRNQNEGVVTSLSTIRGTVNNLSASAFMYITGPLIDEMPWIKALEWAPRVRPGERVSFETAMRASGSPEFQIYPTPFERVDPKGMPEMVPDHFPVAYVSPLVGNESALGLNLTSEPHRAEALMDSIEHNRRSTTKPIVLVQEEEENSYGYLTFSPVHPRGATDPDDNTGVIVGVFRFNDIVRSALQDHPLENYNFVLRDRRDPDIEVFTSFGPRESREAGMQGNGTAGFSLALGANSPWVADIYPSVGIYDFSNWWHIWTLLFGGVVLISLGIYYFTIISAQPELVRMTIDERTAELQKTTASLQQLNEELEQRVANRTAELTDANKELNLFVSAVSHDLRSPLAKLNMFVTSLRKSLGNTKQNQEAEAALSAIDNATHSMTNLISGMLDLSRKSNQAIDITAVPLDEIIHHVLVDMEMEIKDSGITIDWEPLPVVIGDKVLLTQLYTNLISNAIKFSSTKEQPKLKIGQRNMPRKNEITLTVEDNGIGIPIERRAEAFTAFSRVHGDGQFRGSGIGLSICERIVKRLNGRIWVEDSFLGGAKFCFVLKVAPKDSAL